MTKEIVLSVRKLKLKYKVETTENKYSFSEETIIKYSLFKGREITKEELELILAEEDQNSLMNKAINYLSYQARSVSEVRKYLIEKEATESIADIILEKISDLGYLNDEALAKSLLDYVVRSKKGPRILEQKLTQKEIDEDLIRSTLNKYSEELEEEVVADLLESILPRYKTYPKKKQKMLVYQKLLRDGFSSEVINNYLNRANFIDESDEELEYDLKKLLNRYEEVDYKTRSVVINKLMNKGYEYSKIIECINKVE